MKARVVAAVAAAWIVAAAVAVAEEKQAVGPFLQKISVNVCCPQGGSSKVEGSGTVFRSDVKEGAASWVLTAHHVVEDLREVKTVIDSDGTEKKQVRYRDAQVIQEQVAGGRGVGEVKFDAKVISVDPRRDIALLRVRLGDFAKETVVFYLTEEIPPPGTEVYHCGAPGGKEIGGTCSLTVGIISRQGVRIPEFGGAEHGVFDQTDCAALGGSSGGLIALKENGNWIGMITLGLQGGDSFHWIVPIRSVKEWAGEVGVEWLLDPTKPRPTEQEVGKIPLELNTPGFASGKTPDSTTPAHEIVPMVKE
jgi:S1-C subfamily serine protease